ncbi:MAG: hypothetical protein OXU20_37470 [Myxococcales bacterium]|nr:hypothetical protein [Myxococcales bacterium]MDD9965938.1 hypothetical protein [Myxococcales bacterium]
MLTCTACSRLDGGPFLQRIYADGLVLALLGRDERGRRALWVLPREHGGGSPQGTQALAEHLLAVARRASAALAEEGFEFAIEAAQLDRMSADLAHPHLEVPEGSHECQTGVHRVASRVLTRTHLEWAKPLQSGPNGAKDGTGSGVSDGTRRQPGQRSGQPRG